MNIKNLMESIFGERESFKLPEIILETLQDPKRREETFEKFEAFAKESGANFASDWFTDYFQEEQGNRKDFKQDFTPASLCDIVGGIIGKPDSVADICAGTGGLTIKAWTQTPAAFFHCEELSERALPFLLFNIAIRGMNAEVVHMDVLTREVKKIYRLTPAGKYSTITEAKAFERNKFAAVISNPPYSVTWTPSKDERFEGYGLAPKGKADLAFVLHGLSMMEANGVYVGILPHGVLFRGGEESKIRAELIKQNKLNAVIGVPEKMFINTGIPVCVLVLKNDSGSALFVNAEKLFVKDRKLNRMEPEQVQKVLEVYKNRKAVAKFSAIVTKEELEENGYNCNLPRYVDTYEPEPLPDITELTKNLKETLTEIQNAFSDLEEMAKSLTCTDEDGEAGDVLPYFREFLQTGQKITETEQKKAELFEEIGDKLEAIATGTGSPLGEVSHGGVSDG